jgi:hypothetical protein
MLKSLVDRQDDDLAGASQSPGVHEAPEIADDARILSSVVCQDLLDSIAHARSLRFRQRP